MIVYVITDDSGFIKVGVTTGCPKKRLSVMQNGNPRRLRYLRQYDVTGLDIMAIESHLHKLLEPHRAEGSTEWFRFTPLTIPAIDRHIELVRSNQITLPAGKKSHRPRETGEVTAREIEAVMNQDRRENDKRVDFIQSLLLVRLVVDCGVAIHEANNIELANVHGESITIHGRKPRTVPIWYREAWEELERYKQSREDDFPLLFHYKLSRVHQRSMTNRWRSAFQIHCTCGAKRQESHADGCRGGVVPFAGLRYFARRAHADGYSLAEISKVFGHVRIESTAAMLKHQS